MAPAARFGMPDVPVGPSVRLDEIALLPIVKLGDDATIQDVARAMMATALPAVVLAAPTGWSIVTEQDVVAAVSAAIDATAPATRIASSNPIVVSCDLCLLDALVVMLRRGVRNLPVVDEQGELIGLLTMRAALEALLAGADIPNWVAAFRTALRLHV